VKINFGLVQFDFFLVPVVGENKSLVKKIGNPF